MDDMGATTCIICCLRSDLFCVAACGHPVCFECGVRMRVVCGQLTCAVCRHEVTEMYVVRRPELPAKERLGSFVRHAAFDPCGVRFEDGDARQAVLDILAHVCTVCRDEPEYASLAALERHMSQAHRLHYCKLCSEHLNLFTWERRCYTREDLVQHRRQGDSDDHSYKGHPACRFCDERFMDEDALYRHLRKDHFFCQFCDADGLNAFYDDYAKLEAHFKRSHFLCEEGTCGTERGPQCAFRTQIDLKGHKAKEHHSREHIQNQLDFTFAREPVPPPPPARGYNNYRGSSSRQQQRRPPFNENRPQQPPMAQSDDRQQQAQGGRGRAAQNRPVVDRRPRPKIPGASEQGQGDYELVPTQTTDTKAKVVTMYRVQTGVDLAGQSAGDYERGETDFPSLAPGAQGSGQQHGSKWFGRVASSPNFADFPALRRGDGERGGQQRPLSSAAPEPKAAAAPPTKGGDKPKRAGLVLIDDDDDFPSLAMRNENNAQVASTSTVSQAPDEPAARPRPKPYDALLSSAGSGAAWAGGKNTLSGAAGCLLDFPKLAAASKKPQAAKFALGSAKPNAWAVGGNPLAEPAPKPAEFTVTDYNDHGNRGLPDDASSLTKLLPQNVVVRRAKLRKIGARNQQQAHGGSTDEQAKAATSDKALAGADAAAVAGPGPPPGFEPQVPPAPPPGFEPPPQSAPSAGGDAYIRPPDFDARNAKLFDRIRAFLVARGNEAGVAEFKNLSRQFKTGALPPADFYAGVRSLLGKAEFKRAFPEMLCLLPDVGRQRQLLAAHLDELKWEKCGARAKKSAWGAGGQNKPPAAPGGGDPLQRGEGDFWWPCPDCGQIVAVFDQFRHTTAHDAQQQQQQRAVRAK